MDDGFVSILNQPRRVDSADGFVSIINQSTSAPVEKEDTSIPEELFKGVKSGWLNANQSVGQILEYTGKLTGAEPLENIGRTANEYWGGLMEPNKAAVQNMTDIDSFNNFGKWAAWNVGQMGSQLAVTAPFMAAGKVAKGIPTGIEAVKALVARSPGSAGKFGSFLGNWAKLKPMDIPIGVLEAGQIAGGQLEALKKGEINELHPIRALAATFVATKLEELGAENALNRLMHGVGGRRGRLLARIGKGALNTGIGEGTEEFFQQYAEQLGINPKDITSKENFMNAVNGAGAGFIGGFFLGGGGGAISRQTENKTQPDQQTIPAGAPETPLAGESPTGPIIPGAPAPPTHGRAQKLTPEFFRDVQKAISTGVDNDGQPFTQDDAKTILEAYKAQPGADPVSIRTFELLFGNTKPKTIIPKVPIENDVPANLGVPEEVTPEQTLSGFQTFLEQSPEMADVTLQKNNILAKHPQLADDLNKAIIDYQGSKLNKGTVGIAPAVLGNTRIDLLPSGWKMEVGRTRTKEGHTAEAEVDWQGKRIVFADKRHMENPDIVNHEIAHVTIETMPDNSALLANYVKAKSAEWIAKGYDPEWIIKNKFHREEIAMDYGNYLNNPESVPPTLRALFDNLDIKATETLPTTPASTEIVQPAPTSGKQPLIEEARKYKSADEFVNSQNPVYHGTFEKFEQFDSGKLGQNTGAPSAKEGFFFSTNKNVAEGYAGDLTKQLKVMGEKASKAESEIKELTGDSSTMVSSKLYRKEYSPEIAKQLRKKLKIIDDYDGLRAGLDDMPMAYSSKLARSGNLKEAYLDIKNPLIHDMKGEGFRDVSYKNLITQAKKEGRDSVIIKNTYDAMNPAADALTDIQIVFDNNQIKTRVDLTDIWNKTQSPSVLKDYPELAGTKTEVPAPKKPPKREKGAENMVTRIIELGGINPGKDYNVKLLKQDVDGKRVINFKTGLAPDEMALQLQNEGFSLESSDQMMEILKTGEGRKIYAPEKSDKLLNRDIKRLENEWIAEQLAKEGEEVDVSAVEESRGDIETGLLGSLEAEGYTPEQIEANAGEVDSFFSDIIKTNEYEKQAADKGIKFNGMQKFPKRESMPMFTADIGGVPTTFVLEAGETLDQAIDRKHRQKAEYEQRNEPVKKEAPKGEKLSDSSARAWLDENAPGANERFPLPRKETPKGDFKNADLEGFSERETFSLVNPETEISKGLSEQVTPKNEEMFAEKAEPMDGWETHIIKARAYAQQLGIEFQGDSLEAIVRKIKDKLAGVKAEAPAVTSGNFDPLEDIPPTNEKDASEHLAFWLKEVEASRDRIFSEKFTAHDARVIHQGPIIAQRLANWMELKDNERWGKEQPSITRVSREALHVSFAGMAHGWEGTAGKEARHFEPYIKDMRDRLNNFNNGKGFIESVPVVKGEAPAAVSTHPAVSIADKVSKFLTTSKTPLDSNTLFSWADEAYGGTQAQGKYSVKDAYDAMELGVNKFLSTATHYKVTTPDAAYAKENVAAIKTQVMEKLPTQSKRTTEMDKFQQFSTPPTISYLANWVANIQKGETYLEPSAGIGGLAVFGKNAGAHVIVNELSSRRRAILEQMGFDQVLKENAEQINNILPKDIKPTIIVMNPPFSATAGRVQTTSSAEGFKHVEQALKRLEPNGRAVVILGKGVTDTNSFRKWLTSLGNEYTLKADIGISGKEYQKYGTTFGNQLLVFDKVAQVPDIKPVTADVEKVEDAIDLLKGVRDERITGEQKALESKSEAIPQTSEGIARPVKPVLPAIGEVGTGTRGSGNRLPGEGVTADINAGTARTGNEETGGTQPGRPGRIPEPVKRPQETGRPGVVDIGQGEGNTGAVSGVESTTDERIKLENKTVKNKKVEELSDSVYENYRPQKVNIPGAKTHPGKLVESAAMSVVDPPDPTYTPNIPKRIIKEGNLSAAQLESIVYAGQAHSEILPNGDRKGYFIGDGTGVGKGREIAGILLDNWRQGRTRAIWVSQNSPLIEDAKRDVRGIGWNDSLILDLSKAKIASEIPKDRQGVYFVGYSLLKMEDKKSTTEAAKAAGETPNSRLKQIVDWFGKDYDGVIIFDEAHNMGNALAVKGKRGTSKPSATALAGIKLQKELPNARVVYVSATGATEVMNLSYADRLGLWGEGTPFANKGDFINQISSGGIAAMELVARDMKAMGNYLARSLSFDDVKYEPLHHELTAQQRELYDEFAGAWQIVLSNINDALKITQGAKSGKGKSAALAQFWGSSQRFFNQVITSMQTPAVVNSIEKDLAAGHSVVLQIVNTNEAATGRALARMEEGDELEDLDLTPKEQIMDYVKNSFPVAQYEPVEDAEGNITYVVVTDSNGVPVENADAVALREELLNKLGGIRGIDGPMEILLNHFGTDKIAEITGRTRRVVYAKDENGNKVKVIERRSKAKTMADADAFMNDKKPILIFSYAGGTGRSYHADLAVKNQRLRRHYLLQAGWRADRAIQGFGRTHRSSQKQAPEYVLVTTDIIGQKRFISSIARRLDQLGALTRGQRETGSGGFFTARDNLESTYAQDALDSMIMSIYHHDGIMSMSEFIQQTGLHNLINTDTGQLNENNMPSVTQFLNRLLAMTLDNQAIVFEDFSQRMDANIRQAMESGDLDVGLETLKAKNINKISEQIVHTDKSGAQTKYVELDVTKDAHLLPFSETKGGWSEGGFYRNVKSGQVWMASMKKLKTNANTGEVTSHRTLRGPARTSHDIEESHLGDPERYISMSKEDAKELWNKQHDALPKVVTYRENLITGTILPIWDRLKGKARIMRVQTDAGERMIGRLIPHDELVSTLQNLGVSSSKVEHTPKDVFHQVRDMGFQAELANGWKIIRRRVSGENRIELVGPDYRHVQELSKHGVFEERIQYQTRYFIPTTEEGIKTIEAITSNRPVVNTIAPAKVREDLGHGDQYSATPDQTPLPTLADVKDIFKGQEVWEQEGGIFIKTRSGASVCVIGVDNISVNEKDFRMGYNRKIGFGERVAGGYGRNKELQMGVIKLLKDAAGKWTLAHESGHFMEDFGIINASDVAILKGHIKGLVRDGRMESANKDDIGGSEDRANFIADELTKETPKKGLVGRVIARIKEFIDRLMQAFGKKRTAGNVVKDIKTGEIFDRDLTGETTSGNKYAVTNKPGTANIPAKENPVAEAEKGVSLILNKEETAKMQPYADTKGMERHDVYSDGKIVGYIDAAKGINDTETLYINHITIDEKYQRQGIGTKALKELQKQTGTKDIRQTTDLTQAGKGFFNKHIPPETTPKAVGGNNVIEGELPAGTVIKVRLPNAAGNGGGAEGYLNKNGEVLVDGNWYKPGDVAYFGEPDYPNKTLIHKQPTQKTLDSLKREYAGDERVNKIFWAMRGIDDKIPYDGNSESLRYKNVPKELKLEVRNLEGDGLIRPSQKDIEQYLINRQLKNYHEMHFGGGGYLHLTTEPRQLSPNEREAILAWEQKGGGLGRTALVSLERGKETKAWGYESPEGPEKKIKPLPNPTRPPEVGGNIQYSVQSTLNNKEGYKKAEPSEENPTTPGGIKKAIQNETDLILQEFIHQLSPDIHKMSGLKKFLSAPEWYDHPVLSRIVRIFVRDRAEIRQELMNYLNNLEQPQVNINTVGELALNLKHKGMNWKQKMTGKASKDYQDLEKILDGADIDNITYTEANLKHQGYSEDTIKAWRAMRDGYDKELDLKLTQMKEMINQLEEEAAFKGISPVDYSDLYMTLKGALASMGELRGSYAPRIRQGDWAVTARRKQTGARSEEYEYYRGHKFSHMAAERLSRKLKAEGWEIQHVGEVQKLPEDVYQDIKTISVAKAIEAALDSMSKGKGGTASQEQALRFNEDLLRNVAEEIKARGFRSSEIRRSQGIATSGYITDPIERFSIHMSNTASGMAKAQTAQAAMEQLLGNTIKGRRFGGINPKTEPEIYSTAKDYIEEQLRNADKSDRVIGLAKSIATLRFLGFSVRSAVVNTTSIVTTSPGAIHQYVTEGKVGIMKIQRYLGIAGKDAAKFMTGKFTGTDDEIRFLQDEKRLGWDDPQYTRDMISKIGSTGNKTWAATMDGAMWMFGKTEQWNRLTTMLASYRLARELGKNHAEASELAKTASDKSQGIYGKATLPSVAWGRNPAAKVAQMIYTYTKFSHNYLHLLHDLGFKKGNWKAFFYTLLAPMILSGLAAFPLKDITIMPLLGILLTVLGIKDKNEDIQKWIWDQTRKYLGEGAEIAGRYGIMGASGLDVSGSLSIGVGIPKDFWEWGGAIGGAAKEVKTAFGEARKGNYFQTAEHLLPAGLANVTKAVRESQEGVTTQRGNRVFDKTGRPFEPTAGETAKRVLGFRSARQAATTERLYEAKQQVAEFNAKRSTIYETYRAYLAKPEGRRDADQHKKIREQVREFNKGIRAAHMTGEVADITYESMRRQAEKMKMASKKERAMMR